MYHILISTKRRKEKKGTQRIEKNHNKPKPKGKKGKKKQKERKYKNTHSLTQKYIKKYACYIITILEILIYERKNVILFCFYHSSIAKKKILQQ